MDVADSTAVMWFRRDLRIRDNPALLEAASAAKKVVALFVIDNESFDQLGKPKAAFLISALDALQSELGGKLCIRTGSPDEVVAEVAQESGANKVFCASDYLPGAADDEASVRKALESSNRELVTVGSPYAVDPGFILNEQGNPYKVFAPFFAQWQSHDPGSVRNAPRSLQLADLASQEVPKAPKVTCDLPEAGENGAKKQLKRFLDVGLGGYDNGRDLPGVEGTSRLSAYLNAGCIHPRQVIAAVRASRSSHDKHVMSFIRELAFREFYADSLFHNPRLADESYDSKLAKLRQDTGKLADERFDAWTSGKTGYPIVDAGMRQLLSEGWIHNRVRMIVASFLIKDLHIDWQRGAQWFMEHLVDADPANNSLGWQWVAGTGPGAAPFFRIFNPVTQSQRFDPSGSYIKKYVGELATVDTRFIHEPWKRPDGLPAKYVQPIVVHSDERADALARYSQI